MTANKTLLALMSLAIVSAAIAFGYYTLGSHRGDKPLPSTLTLASPNGKTTINLIERIEETRQPVLRRNSVVRFTVFRDGKRIVDNEPFVVDSPGVDFLSRYPRHAWISDSLLRFIRSSPPAEPMRAEMLVVNDTNKEITYMHIVAGDLFLVTQIQPKSRFTFEAESVSLQRGELSHIASKGRFADGGEIREESVNFNTDRKSANPAHYSIIINEKGVVISSQEFEKYSFNAPPSSE